MAEGEGRGGICSPLGGLFDDNCAILFFILVFLFLFFNPCHKF